MWAGMNGMSLKNIANITNDSIIKISDTKPDETVLPNELEVDG